MTVKIQHWRDPPGDVVPTGDGGAIVNEDGTFDAPDAAFVEQVAEAIGMDPTDLLTDECPFCDDYTGEYVPSHAAQAHPDAWDRFNGGVE